MLWQSVTYIRNYVMLCQSSEPLLLSTDQSFAPFNLSIHNIDDIVAYLGWLDPKSMGRWHLTLSDVMFEKLI